MLGLVLAYTVKMSNKTKNKKPIQKRNKKQADVKSARIKKMKIIRTFISWTILIAIFIGLLVFLGTAELFDICDIDVTGNSQVSKQTILQLSKIELQDNIFRTNITKAKNKISENPYIKEVTIKRELPDKIKIEIIEKQKSYILQLDDQYAYIDSDGNILEISNEKLENLIIIKGYLTKNTEIVAGNTLNEEDIERLQDIQTILRSCEKIEIKDKIESINISNKNDYILNLPIYKKIIYIGDTSNLSTKMLRMKDIINKTTDLEGKIFVNGQFNKGFDPYFREEANN